MSSEWLYRFDGLLNGQLAFLDENHQLDPVVLRHRHFTCVEVSYKTKTSMVTSVGLVVEIMDYVIHVRHSSVNAYGVVERQAVYESADAATETLRVAFLTLRR